MGALPRGEAEWGGTEEGGGPQLYLTRNTELSPFPGFSG